MDMTEYQLLSHKTSRYFSSGTMSKDHILMSILGLCGESGELADLIKKQVYHGHLTSLDQINLELGDILWYLAEACTAFGFTLEEIAQTNIAKLKARYGEAFSTEASMNRSE